MMGDKIGCGLRKRIAGKYIYCGKDYICRQCKTKEEIAVLTGSKDGR